MNDKKIVRMSFLNQIFSYFKKNLRNLIILLSICFIIFLSFQIFNFYSLNKIQNSSIDFFNAQNLKDLNSIEETILKLSNEKNFYGILSKLELINIKIQGQNYKNAIDLYNEILDNKKLDNIYKSAIASIASYQFLDINFIDLSKNYTQHIETFISYIDDEIITYQGIKLELNYLVLILEAEKNNIKYLNYSKAIDLYSSIVNSDIVSSAVKERIKKIHEFYSYK